LACPNYTKHFLSVAISLLFMLTAFSQQVKVSGRVLDMSGKTPLEAVSVLSTSGYGTLTDSLGRYSIRVNQDDSIWFSYLGKPTSKYPVTAIPNIYGFEISLHVNVTELKEVRVMPRSYRRDSIQNREDYAKAFNFSKPRLSTSALPTGSYGAGVGLDLDALIGMFQWRKNRRMLAFQERLLREEEEKFIDHRFSRQLVIRITSLRGKDLDTFMRRYRPNLEFTQFATDYEFQSYVKTASLRYLRLKRFLGEMKEEKQE
jgi:hypothetical protein